MNKQMLKLIVTKHFMRKLNNISIRDKLALSFIFVVFVPVFIIGLFLIQELRQMSLDNAINQTTENMERVKKRTAEVLKTSYDISTRFLFDSQFKRIMNTRYESTIEIVEAYRDYRDFEGYIRFYREISNIRFYMDNPTLLENWEFFHLEDSVKEKSWYQEVQRGKGKVGWYYIEDETKNNRKFLSLIRQIDFGEFKTHGILLITINPAYLSHILEQETFETMIVDENNRIIAANRNHRIGATLAELGYQMNQSSAENNRMSEIVVNGKSSKMIVEELIPEGSFNGLKIVTIFSVEEIVMDANRISYLGFSVIFASSIVAMILIWGFSSLLSSRLSRLSNHISKVSLGELDTMVKIDGTDEVGLLARQFNEMVSNIKLLIHQVQLSNEQKNKLEKKQNEIKLKMMASQINPHFLFNTLESIRMKAHIRGEREIAKTVRMLGKLMRKNLEIHGGKIPLKSEIEMIRCYLEIQKFRYMDRLSYEIQLDPKLENILIPSLIIQPLVENSIIHGIENIEQGGVVQIKAESVEDKLIVQVVDNGAGMEMDRLESIIRLLHQEEDETNNRIGLTNVHMRLKLVYGPEYGLQISSSPQTGTMVTFKVPM